MIDPTRLWHPGMEGRINTVLRSGVDPYSYEVSAATLRKVIRECEAGSDSLKRKMLTFLERKVIKGRTTVVVVLLGRAISEFVESIEDEDVLKIADDLYNLNKLPFVKANGRPVS